MPYPFMGNDIRCLNRQSENSVLRCLRRDLLVTQRSPGLCIARQILDFLQIAMLEQLCAF